MTLHRGRNGAPNNRCRFPFPFQYAEKPPSRWDYFPIHAGPQQDTGSPQHKSLPGDAIVDIHLAEFPALTK